MKRVTVRAALAVPLVAVGVLLCLGWSADAQQGKASRWSDQQFIMKASSSGLAEVNLGELALKQGTSPEVKKFAQHLVDDHTKANAELNRLADRKRITPSPAMDPKHRNIADHLAALRGGEFDREFAHQMVKDHKEAVALFEREANEGQDPDLKAFASKTLPTLKEHLKLARKLAGVNEKDDEKGTEHSGKDRNRKDSKNP